MNIEHSFTSQHTLRAFHCVLSFGVIRVRSSPRCRFIHQSSDVESFHLNVMGGGQICDAGRRIRVH